MWATISKNFKFKNYSIVFKIKSEDFSVQYN